MGAILGLAVAGCNSESESDAGTDAGVRTDGGGNTDSGMTTTDAGPGTGTDGGTDAGPPRTDAGPPSCGTALPDGGFSGGRIRVEETCPDFTPCGGEVADTSWCYADICVKKSELLQAAIDRAREDYGVLGLGECYIDDVTVLSSDGTASGQVTFGATTFSRQLESHVTGELLVGEDCVPSLGGCFGLGGAINGFLNPVGQPSMGNASCESDPSCPSADCRCLCDISFDNSIDESGAYVLQNAGSVHQIETNGTREFDYCVSGGSLQFQEVGDPANVEPGLHLTLGVP